MTSESKSSSPHRLLYHHNAGATVRQMGLAGLGIAAVATAALAGFALQHWVQSEPLSPLMMSIVAGLMTVSAGFGYLAYAHASRFVTHFELWPQSQLVHLRTAGLFAESVQLISWQEFRSRREFVPGSTRDPHLRIRLKSGLRLTFEQLNGQAPSGWAALHRFLAKGHEPGSAPGASSSPEFGRPALNFAENDRRVLTSET